MINDFAQDLKGKVLEFQHNVYRKHAELTKEYTHKSTGMRVRLQAWRFSVNYGKACPTNKIQIITNDCEGVKAAVKKIFDEYNEIYDEGYFDLDDDEPSNDWRVECYRTIEERNKAIRKYDKSLEKARKASLCILY